MFETRLTQLLGVKYPIIQGGLQWLATAQLASAVSEAGGLGIISAEEALRIGLVNQVVAHGKVVQAAEEIARKILSKAPLAIDLIKSAIKRGLLNEGAAFTVTGNKLFFKTEDMKEGVDAFLKKRRPNFRGI
jgi:enoyl-CoA hydratase/carnithine racemase